MLSATLNETTIVFPNDFWSSRRALITASKEPASDLVTENCAITLPFLYGLAVGPTKEVCLESAEREVASTRRLLLKAGHVVPLVP